MRRNWILYANLTALDGFNLIKRIYGEKPNFLYAIH